MGNDLFSIESIGKLVGGVVSGGGITSGLDVAKYGLQLILRLTEDNPEKRQKALAEYELGMMNIIKEVPDGTDVTDLTRQFIDLLRDR